MKNKSKTLRLPLKKKWFGLIRLGIKLHEYREINDYWTVRLTHNIGDRHNGVMKVFKSFENVVFTLGYPKSNDDSRHLYFQNPKIRIGTGKEEWGAEPNKKYFVITWDKPENK